MVRHLPYRSSDERTMTPDASRGVCHRLFIYGAGRWGMTDGRVRDYDREGIEQ